MYVCFLFTTIPLGLTIGSTAVPQDQKVNRLLKLVQSLPEENLLVLKYLLAFLNRVSRLADINKMNLQNLGTVFGPNLLRQREENMMSLVKDTPLINEVTQMLIEHESKLTLDARALNLQNYWPLLTSIRCRWMQLRLWKRRNCQSRHQKQDRRLRFQHIN